MEENKYHFTNEELEQELGSWQINPLSDGFASSYKTLYKTNFTTIAAKSFLIPNQETKEIHHFDLSIRIFKRRKKRENWIEQIDENQNPFGFHRQININMGNGKALRELTDFLLAQYELIGTKIENSKVVIDKPSDLDVEVLLKKMSFGQIENFSQGVRIQTLKEYTQFLIDSLDKNEKFIQDWLDEDKGKYRKQRCLIFGLEFIDHKREGELSRKRFDILTRSSTNKNEFVIIELKSPRDNIFKVVESTPNDDDDLRRIGVEAGRVKKCIIILEKRLNDPIWEDHFMSLKSNLSNVLEIWTYSDLIDKLDITIKNLEDNFPI